MEIKKTNTPIESYKYYEKNAINGDLQGIIQELDYLKELGIDLIYLGPIFKSDTTHGYDVTNYFSIAEHISDVSEEVSRKILINFLEEAHKRGIKVILDLVLNHASKEFDFNSVPEDLTVSVEPPQSPQEERWQRSFIFWDLNDKNTKEFLIKVGEYWLKNFDIDGYRLDHALGLPLDFLEEFLSRMKKIKKDVIVIGEVWEDEGNKVKNFQLLKRFKGRDAQRFTSLFDFATYDTIKEIIGMKKGSLKDLYDQIILSNKLNEKEFQLTYFIENHDLPRFIDICKDVEDLKIALGLLMSLTGNIILEYGNEIGLQGDATILHFSESGRVPMKFKEEWNQSEKEMFEYSKKLISLRKNNPALTCGEYDLREANGDVLIFEKKSFDNRVIVLINRGREKYKTNKTYLDIISNKKISSFYKGIYYLKDI
ncbi:hypothetical protein PW5551_02065 [Petrotoga sp. 9PW.55.5.1]|uniref:alpha-amylase family glycosyl hydrolase n=1 Tax=Petrotoga sp. 9PW.55.5.1 TaxID=1308979 RepID=UPI000DC2BF32|nr:alpha-amylase family glycosyl hydrolase [Petrotoga sp. 9PW.55.5.1]RAO99834.1 hypothetical protein PW5551_02065 [Petrotoga sp. 9PW.55.5.1]